VPSPPKSLLVALRVELLDIEPLIWRRIVVSNQWTFNALHSYLQWVMGWQDSHAHEFRVADSRIAPDWWIKEAAFGSDVGTYRDERRTSIASVMRELGSGAQFEYRYDMGDGWIHRITVEAVPPGWEGYDLRTPICSAGENACPPEDVGGPHGYRHFLNCLSDPSHAEHADMARWIGGFFDPKGFDLNRLNRDWKPGRRSVR
jgi:hypothetical protein